MRDTERQTGSLRDFFFHDIGNIFSFFSRLLLGNLYIDVISSGAVVSFYSLIPWPTYGISRFRFDYPKHFFIKEKLKQITTTFKQSS